MPKQEVYNSSTLGPIPLSFTGRRLMQNLREAVQEMVDKAIQDTRKNAGKGWAPQNWEPVSLARGKLVQYMSELEQRVERQEIFDPPPNYVTYNEMKAFVNGQAPLYIQQWGRAERPTKVENNISHMHLPEIPEGYALHIVNGIVSIEPFSMVPEGQMDPNAS